MVNKWLGDKCPVLLLPQEGLALFMARIIRMFSYGAVTVVLMLYLKLCMSEAEMGVLLSGILVGDLVISMILTSRADVVGRQRILMLGAALKVFAGVAFATSTNFWVLLFAGVIGVISSTGGEIGPFLPVEQAALTDLIVKCNEQAASTSQHDHTSQSNDISIAAIFGWYNAAGLCAQAAGAFFAGWLTQALMDSYQLEAIQVYQAIFSLYAVLGGCGIMVYKVFLSQHIEAAHLPPATVGQRKCDCGLKRPETRSIISRISTLFVLDAFAGGLVMQTMLAIWFNKRWNLDMGELGSMIMAANLLSAASGIVAGHLVEKYGAVNTMVFTHLPSHVLLVAVPLMPNATASVIVLLARFCIDKMDVPARQAYVATVVAPDERSAAGGITNVVRSLGVSLAPIPLAAMLGADNVWIFSMPFFIAAVMKTIYDLGIYFSFRATQGYQAAKGSEQSPSTSLSQTVPSAREEDERESSVLMDVKPPQVAVKPAQDVELFETEEEAAAVSGSITAL